MSKVLSYYGYRISWEDSESTDSLKLQMLDDSGYPALGFSFIDVYEDKVHTISVIDDSNKCIFLVFRLKFEWGGLCMPMIQFKPEGDWFYPFTDEINDHRGFTLGALDRVDFPSAGIEGTDVTYTISILVEDSNRDTVEITQDYDGVHTKDGIVNKTLKIYGSGFEAENEFNFEDSISPQELFGSKTALKIKLSQMGR